MLKELNQLYQKQKQNLACLIGLTYKEETRYDCFNSGGLDRVVTEYCAVTGKRIEEKIYSSKEARDLIKQDIRNL